MTIQEVNLETAKKIQSRLMYLGYETQGSPMASDPRYNKPTNEIGHLMRISADTATVEIGAGKHIQITQNGQVVAFIFFEGMVPSPDGSTAALFVGAGVVPGSRREMFSQGAYPSLMSSSTIAEDQIDGIVESLTKEIS